MKTVFTITGPSGSGKSTLERMLCDFGLSFRRVLSTTTRPKREGEIEGEHYNFVDGDEFQFLVDADEFVEHKVFENNGCSYGATLAEFNKCFDEGKVAVIVVEPGGAKAIKAIGEVNGWRVVSVYIDGNMRTLVERLLRREQPIDENSSVEKVSSIAQRILGLVTVEAGWIVRHDWDIVVDRFDADSTHDVIAFLSGVARGVRSSAVV